MFFNPNTLEVHAKAHTQELRHEAEVARQLRSKSAWETPSQTRKIAEHRSVPLPVTEPQVECCP